MFGIPWHFFFPFPSFLCRANCDSCFFKDEEKNHFFLSGKWNFFSRLAKSGKNGHFLLLREKNSAFPNGQYIPRKKCAFLKNVSFFSSDSKAKPSHFKSGKGGSPRINFLFLFFAGRGCWTGKFEPTQTQPSTLANATFNLAPALKFTKNTKAFPAFF